MRLIALSLLLCVGCKKKSHPDASKPIDLTERLGSGQVRAGVVTDEAALFGGIAAEGRAGDIKIYNDRAQFVIQGAHPSGYYLGQGGGVIDADIVRPDGQPGRDRIDELMGMYGFGRLMQAEQALVLNDGRDGSPAHVRVVGYESPLELATGATESPDLFPDLGLEIAVDYRLAPDSYLLGVTTTVTATADVTGLAVGDILMGGPEVSELWSERTGLQAPDGGDQRFTGYIGRYNDGAVGLVAAAGETLQSGGLGLLAELADMAVGFGPTVDIPAGGSIVYTRHYGVGPDMAALSDAALAYDGVPTEVVDGQVTAPDGPVAGARVHVLLDGDPWTVAVTDDQGRFEANVPQGADVDLLAVGRIEGISNDLPAGWAPNGPYASAPARKLTLDSLANGAEVVPAAMGRGVADPKKPLVLGEPATITVKSGDKAPFEARVLMTAPDAVVDERLVAGRIRGGTAAVGWSTDGDVDIIVEPGTYDVLVHRGIRYELHMEQVTVGGGEKATVQAALPKAYDHDEWLLGDPHSHAAPSNDAEISMEDRLLSMAGVGIQLHFGTDHDNVGDYRPLVQAMGLGPHLASVVADEVSPVTRGHHNIYPLKFQPELPNGGAWPWWSELHADFPTARMHRTLRERHGDIIIQSNHPQDAGLADSAQWSPGTIGRPERWGDDLDAVEVNNAGKTGDHLAFWIDLVNHGVTATPVGVSDSHSHFGGGQGLNATFLHLGSDEVGDYTDKGLVQAVRAGETIVTRGPFLDLSITPGATIRSGRTLDVAALSPSWIQVDRLVLHKNGEPVQTVNGTTASFVLDSNRDAWFTVVAEGDTSMNPLYGDTPWAMSAPIYVDVGGDGWKAPGGKLR